WVSRPAGDARRRDRRPPRPLRATGGTVNGSSRGVTSRIRPRRLRFSSVGSPSATISPQPCLAPVALEFGWLIAYTCRRFAAIHDRPASVLRAMSLLFGALPFPRSHALIMIDCETFAAILVRAAIHGRS